MLPALGCGVEVREFWEGLGRLLLLGIAVALGCLVPIFWHYVSERGMLLETVFNFVVGKSAAVLGTTIFQTLVFTALWFGQAGSKAYNVTEKDYRECVAVAYALSMQEAHCFGPCVDGCESVPLISLTPSGQDPEIEHLPIPLDEPAVVRPNTHIAPLPRS